MEAVLCRLCSALNSPYLTHPHNNPRGRRFYPYFTDEGTEALGPDCFLRIKKCDSKPDCLMLKRVLTTTTVSACPPPSGDREYSSSTYTVLVSYVALAFTNPLRQTPRQGWDRDFNGSSEPSADTPTTTPNGEVWRGNVLHRLFEKRG